MHRKTDKKLNTIGAIIKSKELADTADNSLTFVRQRVDLISI